jgi:formylglycine-generating enzyme required for sulfatase activity
MVVIPAGSFLMGSPDDGWQSTAEGPQHEVRISLPFAFGRYTVTRGEFARFAESTGQQLGGLLMWREPSGLFSSFRSGKWVEDTSRNWKSPGFAQTDREPVVGVSWEDAKAYCAWLAEQTGEPYRLPSEAEWEYACRAETTTPFWTGATISVDLANYDGNFTYGDGKTGVARMKTVPVDDPAFRANPFGLYHMHGNVWEWCEDCWHDDYRQAPADGSAWTSGCAEPPRRVLRGGSWIDHPKILRSASRNGLRPGDRLYDAGFRVARALTR